MSPTPLLLLLLVLVSMALLSPSTTTLRERFMPLVLCFCRKGSFLSPECYLGT